MRTWKKIVIILLVVLVGGFLALLADVVIFGWTAKPERAGCIIILGASVYGTVPSPALLGRLEEGLRLYRQGYASAFIVSGAQGRGEAISEAEAMRRYLLEKGIPAEAILLEDRSHSTWENLRFSQAIMQQRGMKRAVVVSNRFHLQRAALMAQRLGMEASYSGIFMAQHPSTEIKGFLRETAAILSFLLMGPSAGG